MSHMLCLFSRHCFLMQKKRVSGRQEVKIKMKWAGSGGGEGERGQSWCVSQWIDSASENHPAQETESCRHTHTSLCSAHLQAARLGVSNTLPPASHWRRNITSSSERWLTRHPRFGWDRFCGVCVRSNGAWDGLDISLGGRRDTPTWAETLPGPNTHANYCGPISQASSLATHA